MDCFKHNFGVDYYPEHWPKERWETDAALMQKMGLTLVRLAEFSWHKMEPEEGKFDFTWLDEAIDVLAAHGIEVVLGTPTAAPPAWLINKYPEILPVDSNGIIHNFGGRHHDCQSNPVYREYCAKITTAMAEHFKDNPAVIGWQIDNELGNSHDDFCHCPSCRRAFQGWLEKKYKTVDELNKRWGTAFWSQEYNSFSEVFTPMITAAGQNPSQVLDFRCFHSDLILDFAKAQADILRHICPNHFITHNCMDFSDTVNYFELGKMLDFTSQDQYPLGYWFENGKSPVHRAAACVDMVRSFKKQPIWIMEQEAGMTGWGSMSRLPKLGELEEMTMQSIAHGADTVVYFRWRSCAFGTEQYWHGILPHSGIPGRSFYELKRLIEDVAPIMDRMKGAMPENKAAIVWSYRQEYAFRIQPHNDKFNYGEQILRYYKALYDKNISADFVGDDDDISKYSLVIAPLQYLVSEEMADKYKKYVENGGTLILTMRSGVKDEYNICNTEEPLPGRLRELAGISVYEYDSLINGDVKVVTNDGKTGAAIAWADLITTDVDDETETLAVYTEEFYHGTPCATLHRVGQGTCIYVGCEPDEDLCAYIIKTAMETAGIKREYFSMKGIEITSRVKDGEKYIFAVNTTGKTGHYTGISGEQLLGEDPGILAPFETHIYLQK